MVSCAEVTIENTISTMFFILIVCFAILTRILSFAEDLPHAKILAEVRSEFGDRKFPIIQASIDHRAIRATSLTSNELRDQKINIMERSAAMFGVEPSASTLKVFGVGLSRTGTSKLASFFTTMGLKVIHFDMDLTAHLPRSANTSFEWRGVYDGFDAVFDLPTAFYYRELLSVYPQALFVSSYRTPDNWYASFANYLQVTSDGVYMGAGLNMVDGWMDYGAFDFPYQQYMESFVDPLQPWKRGLEDKQYPYVPLIPYRTAESPAFVKRPWDFYCSWSDQGLLFYYFFMLQNTGGIIDPEDQSHEIVHFVSTF